MPRRQERTPLVALDGVPPVEPYLSRRRAAPQEFAPQFAFAAVLFERELYYVALHGPSGVHAEPTPAATAAWDPHPATAAGRAAIAAVYGNTIDAAAAAAWDLFGLKAEALAGLTAVLRRSRAHATARLLASAFAADLGDRPQALDLAALVLDDVPGHRAALARAIAALAPLAAAQPRLLARYRSLERLARRLAGDAWMSALTRAREAHELEVRRAAWRARAETEGERFTRLLRSEEEFCADARAASNAAIDEARVPERFRPLLPLARRFGVGDDVCRRRFVTRATKREREAAVRRVGPLAGDIQRWVDGFEPQSFPPEVAAFFWLLEALEEMRPR